MLSWHCRISEEDTVDSAKGQQMAEKLNEAAVTLSNPLTGIGCALGLGLGLQLVLPAVHGGRWTVDGKGDGAWKVFCELFAFGLASNLAFYYAQKSH